MDGIEVGTSEAGTGPCNEVLSEQFGKPRGKRRITKGKRDAEDRSGICTTTNRRKRVRKFLDAVPIVHTNEFPTEIQRERARQFVVNIHPSEFLNDERLR